MIRFQMVGRHACYIPFRTNGRVLDVLKYSNDSGPKRKTRTKKQRIHNQHEVVRYVKEQFKDLNKHNDEKSENLLRGEKKQILHTLLTNPSQLLGFNLDELKRRIEIFRSAGMSINDSITLSLSLSSCLHVNDNNFKRIVKLLRQYELPVEKMLYENPYLGALDHRQVERNLLLFKEMNLTEGLPSLIEKHPILLSYALTKHTVDIIKQRNCVVGDKKTALQNIEISLNLAAVENKAVKSILEVGNKEIDVNTDARIFLVTYDVDIEKIYLACPEFFLTSKQKLEKCLENVLSAPFYFGAEDVEKLLMSYPDVFISFNQELIMKQVEYVEEISTRKVRLYKLLSERPEFFQNPNKFFERVALFKQYGLKDGDMGRLVAQKGATNCFIDCEDFTDTSLAEMLNFYMKPKDLTVSQVVFSSPVCLSKKSAPIIYDRLSFMRYKGMVTKIGPKKKDRKNPVILQSIIRDDLRDFVENICEATIDEYESFCSKYCNDQGISEVI